MSRANASIKALRALSQSKIILHKDMSRHIRELTGRNERLLAVVCGSIVEINLRGLIESAMPNGPDKLFEPHAPLSTFSAKSSLAYSLGLISADLRRNTEYIREIRNVFAHRIAPTNFKIKEVADVCRLLTLGKWEETKRAEMDMRQRFVSASVETARAICVRQFSPEASQPASLPETRPLRPLPIGRGSHRR